MKRRLVIVSVLLIILLLFCFFHVRGSELTGFASISEEYSATVIKQPASLTEEVQYSLNGKQIAVLRDLFLETTFTRRLSNGFSYTGAKDKYVITLELTGADGKQLDFFHIFCVGSQYCQISAPYHDLNLNLNIHSPNWQDALERILVG